jgi:metal-sulfur cluster biosynthetic enzyme
VNFDTLESKLQEVQMTAESKKITEADIQQALRDCYDPTLSCNIVDLGLIHSITLTPASDAPGTNIPGVPQKFRATITLTPTTQDETANAQLSAQIANRLAGLEQIIQTTITFLEIPSWTPHRITPAGRRTLGLDGNRTLVQIRQAS